MTASTITARNSIRKQIILLAALAAATIYSIVTDSGNDKLQEVGAVQMHLSGPTPTKTKNSMGSVSELEHRISALVSAGEFYAEPTIEQITEVHSIEHAIVVLEAKKEVSRATIARMYERLAAVTEDYSEPLRADANRFYKRALALYRAGGERTAEPLYQLQKNIVLLSGYRPEESMSALSLVDNPHFENDNPNDKCRLLIVSACELQHTHNGRRLPIAKRAYLFAKAHCPEDMVWAGRMFYEALIDNQNYDQAMAVIGELRDYDQAMVIIDNLRDNFSTESDEFEAVYKRCEMASLKSRGLELKRRHK